MNNKQKDILKAIKFDPLSEAERITGNEYKDDKDTALLGFALQAQKSEALDRMLTQIGDTKLSNTLSYYLSIVQRFGFNIIYTEDFNREGVGEKMYILWNDDLSILLHFDTFTWDNSSEPNM